MREAASQRSRREDNRRKEETDYELLKVASFKRQLKALSARMHDMHLCEKDREMARRHHALLVAAVSSTSAAATAHVPPAQRIFPDPITINSKDVGNGLSELQGAFFQKTEETKKEMPVVGRGWEEEEGEVEEESVATDDVSITPVFAACAEKERLEKIRDELKEAKICFLVGGERGRGRSRNEETLRGTGGAHTQTSACPVPGCVSCNVREEGSAGSGLDDNKTCKLKGQNTSKMIERRLKQDTSLGALAACNGGGRGGQDGGGGKRAG